MSRILEVAPHLTHDELVSRFLECRDGNEKLRWQAVLLKSEGRTTAEIADICKRKVDWVRRTVRRYNKGGPEGMSDHRGGAYAWVMDDEGRKALRKALLNDSPPGGGLWNGPKVARWMSERTGRYISPQTGRNYLALLGFTLQRPRPRHPEADQEAQEAFKKGGFKATLKW